MRIGKAEKCVFRNHRRRSFATSSGQAGTTAPRFLAVCCRKATGGAGKEATGNTAKLAHVSQPRTTVVNRARRSSPERNEEQDSGPRRSSLERDKERDGFARLRWEETREGNTVGGARLTIETGADFPIGINNWSSLPQVYGRLSSMAPSRLEDWRCELLDWWTRFKVDRQNRIRDVIERSFAFAHS